MASVRKYIATSEDKWAELARRAYRALVNFSVPAPRIIMYPILRLTLFLRAVCYFILRVFFCEPLFKAYCKQCGRNVHTGVYLHWVQGRGSIILGDNVTIDGKSRFCFATRYSDNPTLQIGDNTGIGHNCSFTIGKHITIGRNTRIASGVRMFDSAGHPTNPADRLAGLPTPVDDVQPITIGDNVWIGGSCIIYPGVTIGNGSVISMGSVVTANVPANVLVMGNPARQILSLVGTPSPVCKL